MGADLSLEEEEADPSLAISCAIFGNPIMLCFPLPAHPVCLFSRCIYSSLERRCRGSRSLWTIDAYSLELLSCSCSFMFCIHPTLAFCVIETIESEAEGEQMMSLIRCLIKKNRILCIIEKTPKKTKQNVTKPKCEANRNEKQSKRESERKEKESRNEFNRNGNVTKTIDKKISEAKQLNACVCVSP